MKAFAIAALVLCAACGDIDLQRHSYEAPRGSAALEEGDNRVSFWLEPSKSRESTMRATHYREGAPYTLWVTLAMKTEAPQKALVVNELVLEHDGTTIVVHDRKASPLRTDVTASKSKAGEFQAVVKIDLGEQLAWVDGSKVVVKAAVEVPFRDKEIAVEQTFEAQEKTEKGSRVDVLVGQ
jgi:hypothetical protein